MTNEKRLIDANDLIERLKLKKKISEVGLHRGLQSAMSQCDKAPTVDAVVLPCKVGSEVFNIWKSFDDNGVENFEIYIGEVVSFSIQKDSIWAYCQYGNGLNLWHTVDDAFGKTVFLTREEAEAAIAKMDGGNEDA